MNKEGKTKLLTILLAGAGLVIRVLVMALIIMWGWNNIVQEQMGIDAHLNYGTATSAAVYAYFLIQAATLSPD